MKERAGIFVSIKKDGQLRGCIGTFEPSRPNIAEEIIANAISAATRDPAFLPIAPDELEHLSFSVDVLTTTGTGGVWTTWTPRNTASSPNAAGNGACSCRIWKGSIPPRIR